MKTLITLSVLLIQTSLFGTTIQFPDTKEASIQKESKVTIQYTNSDISTKKLFCMIFTQLSAPPETIEMNRKNGIWESTWTHKKDIPVIMIIFQANHPENGPVDDNQGQFYKLFINENGKPLQGAYQTLALSWTGFGDLREEDLNKAMQNVEEELTYYPDNYSAILLKYTILLRMYPEDNNTKRKIKNEISKIVDLAKDDTEVLNFALTGYRLLGEQKRVENIEKRLYTLNPQSEQAALKQLNEILKNEKNTEKRYQKLDHLLVSFVEFPVSEYILSQMATTAIALTDSIKMIRTGDQLLEKSISPAGASALAGLAGVFSENRIEILRAITYTEKAIQIIEQIDNKTRPKELSEEDWQNQIKTTLGRYQDILGWAYFQQGRSKEAIDILEKSINNYLQAGAFFHLAEIYMAINRKEDAYVHYARAAAFGGEIGNWAKNILEETWQNEGKNQRILSKLLLENETWVDNTYRQFILSRRQIKPAPNFELESIQGGTVRLSDQKGVRIVLCFWSTWSQSSLPVLQTLHKLAREIGNDVLFLTVAIEPNRTKVQKFIQKHRFFLPALINEDTDTRFDIQGVPVIFVIDPKGMIHFEHKGYRPDMADILTVELDDIR